MVKINFCCDIYNVQSFKKSFVFLFLLALFSSSISCSSQGNKNSMAQALAAASMLKKQTTRRTSSWVLSPETRISLAQASPHKKLDTQHLARTHNALNQVLFKEFVRFFPHTDTLDNGTEHIFLMAKQKAFQGESELLVVPTLLVSENNINSVKELNEYRNFESKHKVSADKLVLQLAIYESYSSQLIENVTIESSGGRMSFRRANPASMLAPAIRQYLETITAERVLSSR